MPDKCNCPPEGAPLWVLTYGDMMSLLLVFFIMLVAMSEIKKDRPQYTKAVQSIHQAFNMETGTAPVPLYTSETPRTFRQPQLSNAQDPGVDGRQDRVTRVREDLKFVTGGYVTFEPGSADLDDRARAKLVQAAEEVRGLTNKIELRGHASTSEVVEVGPGKRFADLSDLGYARAKAVEAWLVGELGIKAERIRLISCGDREPMIQGVYQTQQLEPNRRVEIIQSEALTEDFTRPQTEP
ncbi:MAG: OmpA family protein [Phycisphaera sp.]|nr:OmpA family protein [Phycisphaera sp.]